MLKLYKNKSSTFTCKIQIEGAKYQNAKPRLVLSDGNKNLLFEGKVERGECIVEIPPIKDLQDKGNLKLEIVVDNGIFEPWNSKYELTESEDVVVENVKLKKQNNKKQTKKPKKQLKEQKKKLPTFRKTITEENKKLVKGLLNAYQGLNEGQKEMIRNIAEKTYKPSDKTKQWANTIFRDINGTFPKICMYEYENYMKKPSKEIKNTEQQNGGKSLYRKMLGI